MTPSQFISLLRQQQRKINQEIDRANKAAADKFVRDYNREVDNINRQNRQMVADHNRKVRQHNHNAQSAVAKYNQAVRAYNSGIGINRQRRLAALRSVSSSHYQVVRESTFDLSDRFERVERSGTSSAYPDLLTLSEREVFNSAAVAQALIAEEPESVEVDQDTGILEYLAGFSQDLCDRWRGALYSLNPINPDAGRHFCTSAREIFNEILEKWADNREVMEADPECELTPNKTAPTRRAKIRFLLKRKGADSPEMLGFVEKDIDDVVQLFHVFNEATHGAAGKHGFSKLQNIRRRVEGGIMFLAAVAL